MSSENRTVYSSEQGKICPYCDKPIKQCVCRKQKSSFGDGNVRVSRETKGRKGKGVTLIKGLDMNSDALASMSKKLRLYLASIRNYLDNIKCARLFCCQHVSLL